VLDSSFKDGSKIQMRMNIYDFIQLCASPSNYSMHSLQMFNAFCKSSVFYLYVTISNDDG